MGDIVSKYWVLWLACLLVGAAPGTIYAIVSDIKHRRKYNAKMKKNLAEFDAFLEDQDKRRGLI